MRRLIYLYIFKEIVPAFLINILVFTFILLMVKVLELTELVVVQGVKAGALVTLLGYSLPMFLSLTIPMSTLLAVLLAFLRLSGDNEITVLKSAGMGLYQMLPPVLLFCLWAYLITSYLTIDLVPRANTAFRNELLTLAKNRADVSIKERVFLDGFQDMVLFVNHIPLGSGLMEDIFIRDSRDAEVSSVVVAKRGRLAMDRERRALVLQLFDGVIDRMDKDLAGTDTIDFRRYELKLNLESDLINKSLTRRDQYEMTLDELWEEAERYKELDDHHYELYLMDAHKRLSLPVACLVLGLAAVPLGIQFQNKGRNWGVTMGMAIFLFYYIILSAGWSFGESGRYPPALGMWMPNLVVGAAALYMMRQANRERPIGLISLVDSFLNLFRSARKEDRT